MTRALVIGVTSQDRGCLPGPMLGNDYKVGGTFRGESPTQFASFYKLGINCKILRLSMMPYDFIGVLSTVNKVNHNEIYNLLGRISVDLSSGSDMWVSAKKDPTNNIQEL